MIAPLHTFASYHPEEPVSADLEAAYRSFLDALDEGLSPAILHSWETTSRGTMSWCHWAHLVFSLDTRDPEAKARLDRSNALETLLTKIDVSVKNRLLQPDRLTGARAFFGDRVLDRWAVDAASFSPTIEDDLTRERSLISDFTAKAASAKIEVRGTTYSLSAIRKLYVSPDRSLREEATRARWGWWEANQATFDTLFDDLVQLRDGMARRLGDTNHVAMGYRRMGRTDFTPAKVATFRQEVVDHVVPLAVAYRKKQAQQLGIERVRIWDEAVHHPGTPPVPVDVEGGMERVLSAVHPELGTHYRSMQQRGLLDLQPREGKAGGGFATLLEGNQTPFVFGNLNGSADDVTLVLHELGHAYQLATTAKHQPRPDAWLPTADTAEVHSMSLELLALPHINSLFATEQEAETYRQESLASALLALPYTAAIDHFQHDVYRNPSASPDERAAFWKRAEALYLPWRDEPDLPCVREGRLWQRQGHLYFAPFYYIDYALARTCSLQLWQQSRRDPEGALAAYLELCRRGGSVGLPEVAKVAGIRSPFEPGCLASVVADLTPLLT